MLREVLPVSIRVSTKRNRKGHSVSGIWRGGELGAIFGFENELMRSDPSMMSLVYRLYR